MKNTNTQLKIGVLALMASLCSTGAVADTATGQAAAVVIEPILIGAVTDMNFNTLAGGSAVGTVIMASGGGMTTTGDADIIGGVTGTPLTFPITGETGVAYTVTTSATATLSNGLATEGTMVLTLASPTGDTGLATGTDNIEVVGTLALVANQAAGNYTTAAGASASPITITANYD